MITAEQIIERLKQFESFVVYETDNGLTTAEYKWESMTQSRRVPVYKIIVVESENFHSVIVQHRISNNSVNLQITFDEFEHGFTERFADDLAQHLAECQEDIEYCDREINRLQKKRSQTLDAVVQWRKHLYLNGGLQDE